MTISRLVKQTSCSFSKKITNIFQSPFMYSSKIATMKPHPLVASFDPHGLNVLLVDNTFTSLFVISRMLEYCDYQVTPCTQPTEALMLLRNGDIKFDMVLTEVHFSQDMSGMKFLEIVQRETDLPVVIVSAEDRIKIMKESVIKGACAYVVKPMGMGIVRFLWQHVIRKKMFGVKQIDNVEEGEPNSSQSGEEKEFCASSDGVHVEDEQVKTPGKKLRLVWTDELHQKFVDAVTQLGIQNAVPKKVLELMNVPGLTRGNVASHLQKFRLSLGKITTHTQKGFTGPKSAAGSSTTENNGLRL